MTASPTGIFDRAQTRQWRQRTLGFLAAALIPGMGAALTAAVLEFAGNWVPPFIELYDTQVGPGEDGNVAASENVERVAKS